MDNQITTMQEVTPTTQKAYDTHARILANGQVMARALVDVGHDLKTMRDEGLYTELGYDTFEEYAKLATARADAEKKTKAAVEKLEQEKADLKRQLDSSATKLDAAVRQAKAAGADTNVAACRVYFTELQQTAAKVQELIGKITTKDPATGAKLSAAVIQVLQSTAQNLEVKQ